MEEVVLHVHPPLDPEAVRRLCAAATDALSRPGTVLVLDVGACDLSVVDALARLSLVTRPAGDRVRLRSPGTGLVGLLVLTGLAGAVPPTS